MNIGTLNIDIATNVARIQKEMAEIKGSIGTAMKDVEQYVGYAKVALVGLGAVTSLGAFKGMIDSAIEGKARLYDISLQTGITVEALSALGKVAKFSNTELTDIAGASNKLSKALFTQNEDSKGAAQALKALGLNFNDFKALSPDQQMLAVAKAMDGFSDGTGKSAGAMLLFGKTGAQLLPFLKELAEKNELVGKQTTESARQAHEYEKNLVALKAAGQEWRNTLVTDMLPYLTEFTGKLIDSRKAYGGWIAALSAGNVDTSGGIGPALKKNLDDVAAAQKQVDEITARKGKSKTGLLSVFDISDDSALSAANIGLEKQLARRKFLMIQQDREDKASFDRIDANRGKPDLGLDAAVAKGAAVADPYIALVAKLREKLEVERMELNMSRNLTAAEKEALDIMVQLRDGKLRLTGARALETRGLLEERIANEALNKARDEEMSLRAQMRTDMQRDLDAQAGNTKTARDALEAMRRTVDEYGMTTEQLQALSAARDRDSAAALRQKSVYADSERDGGALSDEYRQQADALEQLASRKELLASKEANDRNDPLSGANRAVKDYLADVKRAGDATYGVVSGAIKGLEDLTVSALTGGGSRKAANAWVTSILNEVVRLKVVKPFLDQIFGGLGSGGGGGDLLGGIASLIGGFFSGGMSTNNTGTSLPTSGGRADGGPVMAGRNYLVGERGPEILRMGSQAGTVIPNGGAARTVQVQVINNGAPVKAQQTQRETSEGTLITLVLDAVASDMAGGGKVHDATQRRFGLNPGGTTPRY